ncbi:unnamed protein product [Toxocara canis]|uniref:Thiolase_N domain-containing protein n=1 Tax=Toxocara canis TaxID=6265 RepID=A0A183UBZ6_TOXCA|nr:unnamed protein product [Toxocara canis]
MHSSCMGGVHSITAAVWTMRKLYTSRLRWTCDKNRFLTGSTVDTAGLKRVAEGFKAQNATAMSYEGLVDFAGRSYTT